MSEHRDHEPNVLLERILDTEPGIKLKLGTSRRAQDSVLSLQRMPTEALMKRYPELHAKQAQQLKARVDVATAALMRTFRENRLSAATRRAADELKGPLSQSGGPTFENQFLPSWGMNAHPQAVDATTSPAAYLIDLLCFARDHVEVRRDRLKALTLETRRPDLYDLMLDEKTMNREVSQVEVVNHVMERAIDEQRQLAGGDITATQDKLLQVRFPLKQFPYEAYWTQIKTVLAHNGLSLSDVSRLSDIDSPYFIQPGAHSQWSDMALQQDAGLGPALRAILLEAPYFGTGGEVLVNPQTRQLLELPQRSKARRAARQAANGVSFFQDNFGVPAYPTLQNVVSFCQALQMNQDEMESLFALNAYAPVRSDNVTQALRHGAASPDAFGARFINSGGKAPVTVVSNGDTTLHQFKGLTQACCDRVNRLVRLAQALKLSYAETDQIVCAAIEAEQRATAGGTSRQEAAEKPLWMTFNTLRALGLFQFLRERFACDAEAFSALLSNMGIFGTGDTLSQFDRVFNTDTTAPLVLDGQAFDLAGDDAQSKLTIDQLCSGLGINMETFRYLSRVIMQGQGSEVLHRTLPTVSAFYRITLLARLLSITTIELLSLLEVLSPEGQYSVLLAGMPQNAMYQSYTQADTLSAIHAICHCVLWCQEQQLSIAWLVQQLLPIETANVVPEEIGALFSELKNHLVPFQDFDRLLSDAGVMPLKTQSWQHNLAQIVDDQGLITDTGHSEEDFDPEQYEHFAEREIEVTIQRLVSTQDMPSNELPALTVDEAEHLKTLILGVVLRIRSQQWGVVQERLSHFLSLNADIVIPVIYWAEGKAHTLLARAAGFDPDMLQSEGMKAVMPLMQRMQRCARIANQFALSPALFSSLLVTALRPRLSIKGTELTLHTLYFLERYTHCLRLAKQSEEQLLGYFTLVEALGEMTDNEYRLIKDAAAEKVADWLGWGVREVLDVAARVSPDGIIRNLAQLCALVASRALCEKTGLSAASLMKLSRLSSHDDTQAYRAAAQEMLSSLRRDVELHRDEAELRQSLSTRCLVNESRLVANKKDEHTTVTLKLLDMNNQPVSNIRIAWTTDLGVLLDHYSFTDEHGVATVRLQSGKLTGIAHVQASYLLGSKAFAPPVLIDCDEATLKLMPVSGRPREPWALAGNKGTYTFSTTLVDKYINKGVDRLVNWSTSLGEFVDSAGETLTNSAGVSTIKLRSKHAGPGTVAVWYADQNPIYFEIGFADDPYVRSLVLTSSAVADREIRVNTLIVGLDGLPVAGQKLQWACEQAKITGAQQSDENGEAQATLTAEKAGTVTVSVTLVNDDSQAFHTETLTFEVLADATLTKALASKVWPMADGIDASEFEIHVFSSDGKPVERYPVQWTVSGGRVDPVETLTGPDGIARYLLKSEEAGTFTVAATWGEAPHVFEPVSFLPPLEMEILVDGEPVTGPVVITPPVMDKPIMLTCRLAEKHPLLAVPMNLLYAGRASVASLGLVFSPSLGEDNRFEGREATWAITCRETGLRQEANVKFGISHEHALKTVWTDVVVKPLLN